MAPSGSDDDAAVRAAAFQFLSEQTQLRGDVLPFDVLSSGFTWRGRRVPLIGPQGIFKPAVLLDMPLSITTAPERTGRPRPYDDGVSPEGFLTYRYRGEDTEHRDNRGLRLACTRQVPLVYLFGIEKGWYLPHWPAYVVADDRANLCVTVDLREGGATRLGGAATVAEISRAYVVRQTLARVHQAQFRQRVLRAYQERCAICRLRHSELLDAAHILPDSDPRGEPTLPNGIALCKLHHAAFDRHFVGIRPDLTVAVRDALLKEEDGPMLLHGLKGFHGARIVVPRAAAAQPNREFLATRFELFCKAS